MKNIALAVALAAISTAAVAQDELAEGEVVKIDEAQEKMTVRHGPLPNLGMNDPMTMVFRVQDPTMLDMVAPGDAVSFAAERIDGVLTITVLEPSTGS